MKISTALLFEILWAIALEIYQATHAGFRSAINLEVSPAVPLLIYLTITFVILSIVPYKIHSAGNLKIL